MKAHFFVSLVCLLVCGISFAGATKKTRKPASEIRIEGRLADAVMTHLYKFADCKDAPAPSGEYPKHMVCKTKGLNCSATSRGPGLGEGFEFVVDAECTPEGAKKSLSEDMANGLMAALVAGKVSDTGPDGYSIPDKRRRDYEIKGIECKVYTEDANKDFCVVKE